MISSRPHHYYRVGRLSRRTTAVARKALQIHAAYRREPVDVYRPRERGSGSWVDGPSLSHCDDYKNPLWIAIGSETRDTFSRNVSNVDATGGVVVQ